MNVGDLVNFYSTVASFQADYKDRNPGVVLSFKKNKNHQLPGSAEVLWANGSVTSEHSSYLQPAS